MDGGNMTLEVYLDGALQATETVDPTTLVTGRKTHRYQYIFGQVYLESNKTAPRFSDDPDSYSIQWLSPYWTVAFPSEVNCIRGRFPCNYSSQAIEFKAEQKSSSGTPSTVDTGGIEIEYNRPDGAYSHMTVATIKVYFVTAAKTHLIFRDPRNMNRLVNAGANGLIRDD